MNNTGDAKPVPSLFELALAKMTAPERWADLLRRVDPEAIPEMAVAALRRVGVNVVGDPGLVRYAQTKAEDEIERYFDRLQASWDADRQKPGRPSTPLEHDFIIAAAVFKFHVGQTTAAEAKRAALRYLGSPMTLSKIEKGFRRFIRRTARAPTQMNVTFIIATKTLLAGCEAERAQMKRARLRVA